MPGSPRDDRLEWLEFADFTPGIFSNRNLATGINVTATNPAMAQPALTWGCRSLPTGGLGPLPRRLESFPLDTPPGPAATDYTVNGLGTWGFVFPSPGSGLTIDPDHRIEVHLLLSYNVPAGDDFDRHAVWLRERIFETPPVTETIYTQDDLAAGTPTSYQYAYFLKTRMNPSSILDPGVPVMVCIWSNPQRTLFINQVTPDPDTPTATSTIPIDSGTQTLRRAAAHQGRIVVAAYDAYGHGTDVDLSTDENVLYTTVNANDFSTSVPAVYVPEIDATITEWSSMSANQLVVVKRLGGGYVVQGDLDDPTVVRLPNLKSPDGTPTVRGTNSPVGWVYSAGDAGLYLWNGGDSATPISAQLNGDEFTEGLQQDDVDRFGHLGQCDRWVDMLLAPNGWCYDFNAESWWRIEHPEQPDALPNPIVFWSSTTYQGQAIGAVKEFTDDEDVFYLYEYRSLGRSYSWCSHPLWVSRNRYVEVRAANLALQGHGTVTITLYPNSDLTSGTPSTKTITVDSDSIQNFRVDLNCTGYHIIMRLEAEADEEDEDAIAPLIHDVWLGWQNDSNLPVTAS